MQEKSFSSQNLGLLKKFPVPKSPKEQKQITLILVLLLGATVLMIFSAVGYRELPRLWEKINQSGVAVSETVSLVTSTPIPTPKFENEKRQIEEMLVPLRGKYGIYFEEIETKANFAINGDEKMTAASLIKIPVMIALYRESEAGRINLDEIHKLQEGDYMSGAGALQYKSIGYEITFRQMAELMGKQSDNTAFNVVSQKLGTEKIQATINALGMKNTSYSDNLTSPQEMGLLFRKLYLEKIVSEKDRDEILSFITGTIWEDRIPAGVPKGVKVSHKIGTEVGVISDAGIVFSPKPFILVIMSQEVNEIEAKKALPEITRKIYGMFIGEQS